MRGVGEDMSAPIVLLFMDDPYQAAPSFIDGAILANAHQPGLSATAELRARGPLILLAVGPEGGAALARWVAEHGLDGVAGVGLVGVTAPWAERTPRTCPACDTLGAPCGSSIHYDDRRFLPLGPLEPLRAVAERARKGESCNECNGRGDVRIPGSHSASLSDHEYGDPRCGGCAATGRVFRPRLVVACAPDDGVCPSPGCGGRGWHYGPGFSRPQCDRCAGSGKALSSAEVACELLGRRIPDSQSSDGDGAMEVFVWHPDDARRLVEFALPFVAERLTR